MNVLLQHIIQSKNVMYMFSPAFVKILVGYWGGCQNNRYFEKANFFKKGQIDPSNNFVVRADCYNLPSNRLKSIDHLISILTKVLTHQIT